MAWQFVSNAVKGLKAGKNAFKSKKTKRPDFKLEQEDYRSAGKKFTDNVKETLNTDLTPKNIALGVGKIGTAGMIAGTGYGVYDSLANRENELDKQHRPGEASMGAGTLNMMHGAMPEFLGGEKGWDRFNRGWDEYRNSIAEGLYEGSPLTLGLGLSDLGITNPVDQAREAHGLPTLKTNNVKAQIAQEEAKRVAEQQPVQQAIPQNASWEQQRAGLAQAMAKSVKDNPDNPYAWDAAPGFGAVRGSNGEMKYVVPNEPYDPDKAYEREMRDRAYQYYMDAMSMAGSPFATPERRASELARANSLAQAFGLGLSPDVAAMGGGGGLRAGQLSAEAKNAQTLLLKGEENKRNQNEDVRKHIMEQTKDNPEMGLRAVTAFDAANNYDGINPLDEGQMQRKRGEQMSEAELNLMMQQIGANGGKIAGITKRNPLGSFGEIWNTWAPFDFMTIDPNYYVQSNGKEYTLDDSKFSAGAKLRADIAARRNLDQESLNKQFAEYRAKGGDLPFQTWLQQFYAGN